jgi:non-canonical (house-cleaning) NTP pyrophosphatase
MKIMIGSKNPTKGNAVIEAFLESSIFKKDITFNFIEVDSGVPNQPIGLRNYNKCQKQSEEFIHRLSI